MRILFENSAHLILQLVRKWLGKQICWVLNLVKSSDENINLPFSLSFLQKGLIFGNH